MSERKELVKLAWSDGANVAELCRRFGVSRTTAYKWMRRWRESPEAELTDRSRRPWRSPGKTEEDLESRVVAVRKAHRAWGGRKIAKVLERAGLERVPAPSTITGILHRHGLIQEEESAKHKAWVRFEHEHPNDLWQMDFKGHFGLENGRRCHPLTVLDDHSRYALGLRACDNQQGRTVREELRGIFARYGLPRRMLMDNGSPWGDDSEHRHTPLTVWLMRLDIGVTHGRPYHPQTQGKEERFHRTLRAELLPSQHEQLWSDQSQAQARFDAWRPVYNHERPHQALGMIPPAERYRPSERSMPQELEPIEYGPEDHVRRAQSGGQVSFQHRRFRVGQAFTGQPVALRATTQDGLYDVYFCRFHIGQIDLRANGGAAVVAQPELAHLAALVSLPPAEPPLRDKF